MKTRFAGWKAVALLTVAWLAALGASTAEVGAAGQYRREVRPERRPTHGTLLDEVGRLASQVSVGDIARSRAELRGGKLAPAEAAWRHLWIGEWELAGHEEPDQAVWHFLQARKLAPPRSAASGLAAYDLAIAAYYQGRYREAASQFRALLAGKGGSGGYSRRRCALWRRMASACAGLHERNAKLGITEPARLQPKCGVAGLAVCLRALAQPYDEKRLLASCRVTGMGSTMQDLLDACGVLGVSGRALTTDAFALQRLPMPMVAHVEHDHFVAITRADEEGVTYVCSDCGAWPGGERKLNWKQWRAMLPGPYVAVSRPGSADDWLLQAVLAPEKQGPAGPQLATTGPLSGLGLTGMAQRETLALLLRSHVMLFTAPTGLGCGSKPESQKCEECRCCPTDGSGGGSGGPSAGDPVNLATGEEEYRPEPDLTVYNPTGPPVVWRRIYGSLRGPDVPERGAAVYQCDDFGVGWSHDYNVQVQDPSAVSAPQVPQGSTRYAAVTGFEAPAAGLTWDLTRAGAVVATSKAPNGWIVAMYGLGVPFVTVPANALNATGYKLRHTASAPYPALSWVFDVITAGVAPRAVVTGLTATGQDVPPAGLEWDIRRNGVTQATSAAPSGWSVEYQAVPTPSGASEDVLAVGTPLNAPLGVGFTVRHQYGFSTTFSVGASRVQVAVGPSAFRYLVFPNGARFGFSAPAFPTASQPKVRCTPRIPQPLVVDWQYTAGDPAGSYLVTFPDGTRWTTTPALRLSFGSFSGGGVLSYSLARIADRNGNALVFNYAYGASGWPLVSSIANSAGKTLLTVTRATDGTGNVRGVADGYGRSVYYRTRSYPTAGVPEAPGYPQAFLELDTVSQPVPSGTANPPARWSYGYQNVYNGDSGTGVPGGEQLAFLHTITTPSPTGAGTSTTTLNYTPATCTVASIVDGNGNTRLFSEVDALHTQVTIKNPSGAVVYSYTSEFDSLLNHVGTTDGSNSTKTWSADFADANADYRPSATFDGNANRTTYTWDRFGNMLTRTSPRAVRTTYTWDYTAFPLGRLTRVQEGTKTAITLTYYEPSGLVKSVSSPRPGTVGTGAVVAVTYSYDALGNPVAVTEPGNGTAASIITRYNYTADGSYTQAAAVGEPLTVTDNLGKITHLRYDARGNPTVLMDALGSRTDFTYNLADQPLTVLAPATGQSGSGRASTANAYLYPGGPLMTVRAYNESNTQIRQTNFTYGKEGELLTRTGSAEPVAYSYDADYRVTGLTDGNNRKTIYAYNLTGYLAQVTCPGGDVLKYPSYNRNGDPLQRIDGRAIVTNYVYADTESRLTAVQYPAFPALNVTHTYDGYGRRTSTRDGAGLKTVAYDDGDRRTAVTVTYTGVPARTLSYTFFSNGSRQSMTTPAGVFTYAYDGRGGQASLRNPFAETARWAYRDDGLASLRTLGNGAKVLPTYNRRNLVTDLQNQSAGGAILSRFSAMIYDGVANRTALTAALPAATPYAGTVSYLYDVKDQLTRETSTRAGGYTGVFAYDPAGNPTSFKGVAATFNVNNQSTGNTYDKNGNPILYKGVAAAYDPEDRLTKIGTTFTAGYRADGLRAWKAVGTTKTYFLYDAAQPVVEMNAAGAVTATNTFGADGLLSRRVGAVSVFYTFDPQGNVAQRLSSTGVVLTSHIFDAFGVGKSPAAVAEPWGYGAQWGYYTDVETGLQLLTHRYYDPGAGRFLTRDPSRYTGGINLYAYTRNNPVNLSDALGLGPLPAPKPPKFSKKNKALKEYSKLEKETEKNIPCVEKLGQTLKDAWKAASDALSGGDGSGGGGGSE